MNTIFKTMFLGGLISLSLIGLNACTKEQIESDETSYTSILDVTEAGASSVIAANLKTVISDITVYNEDELNILVHMKEEEKLARDVYSVLSQKWNNQVFYRISQAENTHMYAILYLLGNYGTDYTQILETGTFSVPGFQLLYDELVAKGSISVEEAYKVGSLIEEMDITDLIESINNVTGENIKAVFENLEKGSRNHLRAFTNQLTSLGLTYTPTYLSAADYIQIVSTPTEQGNKYQMKGNGNGNGNGRGNGNRNNLSDNRICY
jgi:hypothetical protein